jgi:hypothetical protein
LTTHLSLTLTGGIKMLTQERLKELLHYDPDTGIFINLTQRRGRAKKGAVAGTKNPKGYIIIMIDGKFYYAHRLAWFYFYGEFPEGFLDHKNQNPSNNRICNLRLATTQENAQNISNPRINNKSGFRGVSWYKSTNKWLAHITINRKVKHLGYFDTPEEAHEAYLNAKREIHIFWEEDKHV